MFLATCLLDIFPDVQEILTTTVKANLDKDNKFRDYPLGESVMIIGFFLVLIVEQVVLSIKERHDNGDFLSQPASQSSSFLAPGSSKSSYGSAEPDEGSALLDGQSRARSGSISSVKSITGISNRPISRSTSINSFAGVESANHSTHHDPSSHSPVRSFIMLAALSLHSVFEGLAVGLQPTVETVLSIFGALILHKCIIAFSMGLNLAQSKLSFKKVVTSNAIFCTASPLGIAIGIIIDKYETGVASQLTSGILQGLACGTFLYVTFFEVLPHEFNRPTDRVFKVLFVVVGFIFVNGVVLLEVYTSSSV